MKFSPSNMLENCRTSGNPLTKNKLNFGKGGRNTPNLSRQTAQRRWATFLIIGNMPHNKQDSQTKQQHFPIILFHPNRNYRKKIPQAQKAGIFGSVAKN
ncbi:MAG: hypothetical protein LBT09_10745 [Planctomycetaceae bacterium]|nr:hypothetical protein [Planctomycetaceae bacterium]